MDGVQGYLRVPFSMRRLNVQSYALSAHKIHGPKGAGALVLNSRHRIKPMLAGGGQQNNLRSGTENTTGIAGLKAAIEAYPSDGYAHRPSLCHMQFPRPVQGSYRLYLREIRPVDQKPGCKRKLKKSKVIQLQQ